MFENDKIIAKTYNPDEYYKKIGSLNFNNFIFSLFDNYFRDICAIADNKDMFYSGGITSGKYNIYLIYNKGQNEDFYANGMLLDLESNPEVLKYATIIKRWEVTKSTNTSKNIFTKLCRIRNNYYYQDIENDIYVDNYGFINNFEFYCKLTPFIENNNYLAVFVETNNKSIGFSRVIIRFYNKDFRKEN